MARSTSEGHYTRMHKRACVPAYNQQLLLLVLRCHCVPHALLAVDGALVVGAARKVVHQCLVLQLLQPDVEGKRGLGRACTSVCARRLPGRAKALRAWVALLN